ncbi:MAG: PEP-CTERM sorting domain-containing protein [Planctomycetota bacterium]|nr:PEP-CTERM sorting domain-containing protein [Planctomycetota bacterium]
MGMIAAILLTAGSAKANLFGINSPSSSYALINFDDTTSLNPSAVPGTTNYTTSTSPWNGSSFTMGTQIDPNTLDEAKGNLLGQILGPTTYDVSLNSVRLIQTAGNSGYAHLNLRFNIEYQLDSGGLGSQATISPIFTVDGTVQTGGGFAQFGGTIDYYGMDSSYNPYLLDTVVYSPAIWTAPGPFNGTVSGVAINGTTPILPGTVGGNNSTLTLVGNFSFMVDPATMNVATVPEPATVSLLALGGLAVLRRRRRR